MNGIFALGYHLLFSDGAFLFVMKLEYCFLLVRNSHVLVFSCFGDCHCSNISSFNR